MLMGWKIRNLKSFFWSTNGNWKTKRNRNAPTQPRRVSQRNPEISAFLFPRIAPSQQLIEAELCRWFPDSRMDWRTVRAVASAQWERSWHFTLVLFDKTWDVGNQMFDHTAHQALLAKWHLSLAELGASSTVKKKYDVESVKNCCKTKTCFQHKWDFKRSSENSKTSQTNILSNFRWTPLLGWAWGFTWCSTALSSCSRRVSPTETSYDLHTCTCTSMQCFEHISYVPFKNRFHPSCATSAASFDKNLCRAFLPAAFMVSFMFWTSVLAWRLTFMSLSR